MDDIAYYPTDPMTLLALVWVAFLVIFGTIMSHMRRGEISVLSRAASDPTAPAARSSLTFNVPDRCTESIGRYMDAPIFRSIFIGSEEYLFDRVAPPDVWYPLAPNEHCISPGLVYRQRREA